MAKIVMKLAPWISP